MYTSIKNLVFEGGGILGIAYLGALDYLDEIDILPKIEKVAGTSTGALTACLVSFNIPFLEMKKIASTLDYSKLPENKIIPLRGLSDSFKKTFEELFGDIHSIYRLVNNYGWYSTEYFYNWIKKIINSQFDQKKKKPPYTFEDFQNESIHVNNKKFKNLYVVGTDVSAKTSVVFSYDNTPSMEVAEAIRISLSVPLLFESVKISNKTRNATNNYVFSDGGIMRNFPINIFDYNGINYETLGIQFKNKIKYNDTKNLISYISNLFYAFLKAQEDMYNHDTANNLRTININTGGISSFDFDITPADYKFLYTQGYDAASDYFEDRNQSIRYIY